MCINDDHQDRRQTVDISGDIREACIVASVIFECGDSGARFGEHVFVDKHETHCRTISTLTFDELRPEFSVGAPALDLLGRRDPAHRRVLRLVASDPREGGGGGGPVVGVAPYPEGGDTIRVSLKLHKGR